MSISTAERLAAPQPHPARNTAAIRLVRTLDGVDVPAAGPWQVGTGQRLGLSFRGLRARQLTARILGGTLAVTDELVGSALDFSVLDPQTGCSVQFSARVSRLPAPDTWQADGITTTPSGSRPVALRLRHNGVFHQRGRQPCLWLSIHAIIDVPELSAAVSSWRGGRVRCAAELNLHPGALTVGCDVPS